MNPADLEIRCSGALALRLGALPARNPMEFRMMRDWGCTLVRDHATGQPYFWAPLVNAGATEVSSS